jgi:hypothetical protein
VTMPIRVCAPADYRDAPRAPGTPSAESEMVVAGD